MNILKYIEEVIKPDRFSLPGHFKVFSFLGKLFDIVKSDIYMTINNFFPYLSDSLHLEKHRKALSIMKFSIENEEHIRNKVSFAFQTLERIGEKKELLFFLNIYFKDRFSITLYPQLTFRIGYSRIGYAKIGDERCLVVKIKDLTLLEKDMLSQFLDDFLDPDCSYSVIEDINLITNFKVGYSRIGFIKI